MHNTDRRTLRLCAIFVLAWSGALGASHQAARAADISPCVANAITVTIDAGGGFAGMSHNGELVQLRNDSLDPCTLPAFPRMTMRDTNGVTIATVGRSVAGMPVVVQSGETALAQLQWVADDVFDAGKSATATALTILIGDRTITVPMNATLWSRQSDPLTFKAQPFGVASAIAIPTPNLDANAAPETEFPQKPTCGATNVRLTFAPTNDSSLGGAVITLRNVGAASCTIPPFPALTMRGADGAVVATAVSALGTGPGVSRIAVFPAELATGDVTQGRITWTDTNIFGEAAQRAVVGSIAVQLGDQTLTAPLHTTIWASAKPIVFHEAPFGRPAPGGV